jgi:hypothetical protein
LIWPGAFSQLPLPLQARAGMEIKLMARVNADKVEGATLINLLHIQGTRD